MRALTTFLPPCAKPVAWRTIAAMGEAMSVLDAIIATLVVFASVIGTHWALVVRITKLELGLEAETSARESNVKSLASDVVRLQDDMGKVADATEKLRRRDDFRRGKEAAEISGVEDLPRRRARSETDTFTR